MRKYLVIGLAAVAISGMFTSCTHETGSASDSANLGVVETYEQAFLNRFGTPSPEADWGFGPSTTQAGTRALENEYAGTYAKTTADYLEGLVVSDMQRYTAFTDETLNTYPTLTNKVYVSQKLTYAINGDFNPTDGQTVNTDLGSITFNGTGSAASQDNSISWTGYAYKISRSSYTIVPNFTGTLNLHHQPNGSANSVSIKENGNYMSLWGQSFQNWSWSDQNIGINVSEGHTYELFLAADDGFFGMDTDVSGMKPLGDGRHFRVASGTTITKAFHANGNDENNQPMMNGAVVYVEGTLNLYGYNNNKNTLNGVTIVVADGGHAILNGEVDMSNYGRFVVLGNGSITGTDGSSLKINNGAKSYNAGTINYNGELNVNGSDFYNCGTINLGSMRNTSGGKITNFGHITCGTNKNAADSYNCEMINGCYWHYTGDAGIGKLTMLKNSRLDVDGKAEFTQSWQNLDVQTTTPYDLQKATIASPNILMDKSVVNVGTAFVTNTVFQGPNASNEFAIVKMGKVEVGNGTDLMQRQNCFFDWDITELYNKQSVKYQDIPEADKQYNPWGYLVDYYRVHITKFATPTNSKFYIPAAETDDDCTGAGYGTPGGGDTPTPEPEPEPEPDPEPFEAVVRVIAEDMGDQNLNESSDFDFNDVVFDVTYVEEGKVRIEILAAGGTLPLTIGWDGTGDYITHEVHYRLGYSESTMINTHSKVGYHQDDVKSYKFDYTGTFRKASFKQDVRDYIPVKVRKNGTWYNINADQGRAPGKLCVGTDYTWCNERQDIDSKWKNANGGLFLQYVNNPKLLTSYWYRKADR